MHAPIRTSHTLDALPGRQRLFLHFHDEIQHRETPSISSAFFSQGGGHQFSVIQAFFETIWKRNDGLHFAPVPDSRLVWIAKPKPRHPRIYVESQAIGLPLFASVVAC